MQVPTNKPRDDKTNLVTTLREKLPWPLPRKRPNQGTNETNRHASAFPVGALYTQAQKGHSDTQKKVDDLLHQPNWHSCCTQERLML